MRIDASALMRGHPDLAGKAARAGVAHGRIPRPSRRAPGSIVVGDGIRRFHRLNDAYRSKFGMPVHHLRAAAHQGSRSCGSLSGACSTMPPPRPRPRSPEIARIAALRLDRARHRGRSPRSRTGGSRPTCSTPMRAARPPAYRSSPSSFAGRPTAARRQCHHQRGRPHRSPADRGAADPDRPLRAAFRGRRLSCAAGRRPSPIRPSSTSSRSASPSPSPRATTTSRCW